jgi:hypothetical protein
MAAIVVLLIYLGLIVLWVVGGWKTFEKAGKPGWACIIPIYNWIVAIEIGEKPLWWIVLLFIPIVGPILIYMPFAEKFGKGAGYALGLAFFPFIFYPMLGLGDAQFVGASRPPQGFQPVMPSSPQ